MTIQNLTVLKKVIKKFKAGLFFISMARWLFLLILILFPLQDVWAWGPMGHRIIGEIAETRLLPEVKTKIWKNFNIKKLSGVANWADAVRKNRSEGPWHYCNIKVSKWTYSKNRDCPDGDCVVRGGPVLLDSIAAKLSYRLIDVTPLVSCYQGHAPDKFLHYCKPHPVFVH